MLKMTKQRKRILNYLRNSATPVSAETIYLKEAEHLNLSTVYRALDAFFAHNLVTKFQLKNTTYYLLKTKPHKHYLICEECGNMTEIGCFINDDIKVTAEKHDFLIKYHDLTIYGLCKNCQRD
ncbi:MAG: Fur family transcriptional regulator [Acholeplasmatales bacterium]|jgi:Fur family ferric uptake transcriptional regulator|nr:transcriptional repressor [Acholeplasmataceae bacterium]MDY0114941.1 Fur family transcriptional regulator [Acholeplasmatales bacterium]MCK9234466.1 transcriptional repressor [Acholeplasmataceae bacterium]MCK9289494.1 transcriptional repressor [Acholeplasmataceae bacterium]MCK9427119.1 transcriptional repressor [Acholeplasmataceae bacterium]